MEFDRKIITAYALKNATEHLGKAIPSAVIAGLFNHGLSKDKLKDVMPLVNEVIKEINSFSLNKQEEEFEKLKNIIGKRPERVGLPELSNVKKEGVIMRFAPAASGQLHIGHILAGIPTSLYVERYGGKFYVRIEDTNPEKTDPDSYSGFKRDCDWLFGNVSEYIIQSDRIPIYYKYIEELIDNASSYICACENEAYKKLIKAKMPCPCRSLSIEENKKRWKKMLDKKGYKEGTAVLRFKSDLNNPNPALRDFPLARISLKPHPRQKNKYRVWPLMNLSVTVDDLEYKMTHIIRGKDHKDNAERQKMLYKALGKLNLFPVILFIGRVKFSDFVLSKRKIKAAIEEGEFAGWEDIKLPTIASLRKRGYLPEAFKKLAVERGISEVDKVISQKDFFHILNNINRELLRNKTEKYSFEKTDEKNANIKIIMPESSEIFGKSNVYSKEGDMVYFKGFGYARDNGIEKNLKIFWFCHE